MTLRNRIDTTGSPIKSTGDTMLVKIVTRVRSVALKDTHLPSAEMKSQNATDVAMIAMRVGTGREILSVIEVLITTGTGITEIGEAPTTRVA